MWEIVFGVLTSLGGGALIAAGLVHWLGNVWAKRLIQNEKAKLQLDLESYRIKLKKSEFIFQKEYEAASELVAFIQGILPEHNMPNMDFHDACEEMARNLAHIEKDLRKYLGRHGAILTNIAADKIEIGIYLAGSKKHVLTGHDVPDAAVSAAESIYKNLKDAETSMVEQVRCQSST
jgi:hypothetical protein